MREEPSSNGTCDGRAGRSEQPPRPLPGLRSPPTCEDDQASRPPEPRLSDYPTPAALSSDGHHIWNEDCDAADNYFALGLALAATGDIFRQPGYASGLLLGSPTEAVPPQEIVTGTRLASVIADRLRIRVLKEGRSRSAIPACHLATMLNCEVFLQRFVPVDEITTSPRYLPDFALTAPGFNDGGPGWRLMYAGGEAPVAGSLDAVNSFLDIMAWSSPADRANALAAALTVTLRDHWPGAKPVLVVSATKSHAGKDTTINFASGTTAQVSISYQRTDWALERSFVGAVKHPPHAGVITVENARLDRSGEFIQSAFLERFLTDPEPLLFSTGTGPPVRRKNNLIVAISSNHGNVSQDLLNRALPVHLAPRGDMASRRPAIGNPKHEYLPRYREQIEAELRGMVARWVGAGRPLDNRVQHPMTGWAQTVGGILRVSGVGGFLDNFGLRRTADDPTREALGLLGAARPGEWLRPRDWALLAVRLGLIKAVVSAGDQGTEAGRERGIGKSLRAHADETFTVEGEEERLELRLECARRREGAEPKVRYQFAVRNREPIEL
jgi:hypothetical protein